MAHFCTPRSLHTHSQYLFIFSSWVCSDWRLFEIATRSFAYAVKLMVNFNVPNVYPFLPLCNQRSNGSKNMRNKYGLNVSPWMMPLCIGIGFVFPKCSPVNRPSSTLRSLGPSHLWRHESQASIRVPFVFMVLRALLMERCVTHLKQNKTQIQVTTPSNPFETLPPPQPRNRPDNPIVDQQLTIQLSASKQTPKLRG